jgi:hypothetical protein
MTTVRLYPNELNRLLYMPGGPVGVGVRKLAVKVAAEAAKTARAELGNNPEYAARTGRYAGGFQVEVEYPLATAKGGFRFKVVNRTTGQTPRRSQSYASVIERGAKPHVIKARNPKTKPLVFYINGRKIVTQQVNWKPKSAESRNGHRILERAVLNVFRAL